MVDKLHDGPQEKIMNRFEVTTQNAESGCTTTFVQTRAQADRVFNSAIRYGAVFAEIFDIVNDRQVRVQYPTMVWV